MKERGKAVQAYNNSNNEMEYYYSSASDLPCKKHPSASSVGICAYCLRDRLVKLVCSDCGEQRLSSCSCSDLSPNRNSCAGEVGSVGRVSFLIENERNEVPIISSNSKPPKSHEKTEEVMALRRSNTTCVEINKKSNGFWKFGKLFRKKKEKDYGTKSVAGFDEKSETCIGDNIHMGMLRSRSLCSFRGGGGGGGGWFGSEDGGDLMVSGARSSISGPRSSSVTACMVLDSGRRSGFSEAEPRKSMALESGRRSGFSDAEPRKSMALDSGRRSGFSDAEPRKSMALESGRRSGFSDAEPRKSMAIESGRRSGFSDVVEPRKSGFEGEKRDDTLVSDLGSDLKGLKKIGYVDVDGGFNGASRRVFSLRESDFNGMDDSSFIDLKIDYSTESKSDFSDVKMSSSKSIAEPNFGSMRAGHEFVGGLMRDGIYSHGGSCRITVNDRGGIKKGRKSFKGWRWIFRHNPNLGTSRKKDEDLMFKT